MALKRQTHMKLREFFLSSVDAEYQLEQLRQELAAIPDFEPYTVFQKIDQSNLGHLRVLDFSFFLQKVRLDVPEEDLELFFLNFASNGDMRLGYTDFLDAILPSTDRFLRHSALHRHKYHMDPTKLDKTVDVILGELIVKEIDLYKNVDILKEEVKLCSDWDVHLAFRLIDYNRNGYIDRDSFLKYIRRSEKVTKEEIEPFFRRADKDSDGKLNYTEFVEVFHPYEKYYKSSEYLRKSAEMIRRADLRVQASVDFSEDADFSRISRESSPHFTPDVSNKFAIDNSRDEIISEEKNRHPRSRSPGVRDNSLQYQRDLRSIDSSIESRMYLEKRSYVPVEESLNRSEDKIARNVQSAALNQSKINDSTIQSSSPSKNQLTPEDKARWYIKDIVMSAAKYSQQQAEYFKQQELQHNLIPINIPQNYNSSPQRLSHKSDLSTQSKRPIQKRLEFGDALEGAKESADYELSFRHQNFAVTEQSPKQKSRRGSEGAQTLHPSRSNNFTPQKSYALREEISIRTGKSLKDLKGKAKKPWKPVGPNINKSLEKRLPRSSSPTSKDSARGTETPNKSISQNRSSSASPLSSNKRPRSAGKITTNPHNSMEKTKNEPQENKKSKKVHFGAEKPALQVKSANKKNNRTAVQKGNSKPNKRLMMKGFEEVHFARVLKEIIDLERLVEKAKCDLAVQDDFVPSRAYKQIFDETGKGLCGRIRFKKVIEDYQFNLSSSDAGLIFTHFDQDGDGNFSPSDFEALVTPKDPKFAYRIAVRKSTRPTSSPTHQKLRNLLDAAIFAEVNVEKIRQGLARRELFGFKEAFKILDLSRVGYFGAKDVQTLLSAHKFNINLSEAGWLVGRLDADRDGKVSFKEFVEGLEPKQILTSGKK